MPNDNSTMGERFDEKYINLNTPSGLNQKEYGSFMDMIYDIKQFIQSEIDRAVGEREREIVEALRRFKLPQNSREGGMTTLMYIPDEGFNIEINNRLDTIINEITKQS